jgi:hypothetical protein
VIHPNVELRFVSPEVGYGVFATAPIPMGTLTWIRCALDRTMSPEQVAALAEPYARVFERYAYVDGRGDSVLCWDHARFMNHSCAPTCLSPGFDFDIAVRDMKAGDELTCDYAMLNIEESFACACGVSNCRRTIEPDDGHRIADACDVLLERAVRVLSKRPQPLWPLLRDPERVIAAAEGRIPVPSCRNHLTAALVPPVEIQRQVAGVRR